VALSISTITSTTSLYWLPLSLHGASTTSAHCWGCARSWGCPLQPIKLRTQQHVLFSLGSRLTPSLGNCGFQGTSFRGCRHCCTNGETRGCALARNILESLVGLLNHACKVF
jgi:hypothetical protein